MTLGSHQQTIGNSQRWITAGAHRRPSEELPGEDNPLGRSWHESARKAAEIAKTDWIRISSDKGLGGYRVRKAEGRLSDPQWPDKSFGELLTIAFADRIIMSEDHPVVRRLRGLV
jgi:hypothetical protein